VRLSRPRLLLRAALLMVAGGFMLWKAWGAHVEAGAAAGTPPAALLSRLALVEALMGVLGLVAAGVALAALRTRRRTHTLRLSDLSPGDRAEGPPGDGPRPGPERQ